jgi:hypothetical protein
MSGIISAWSFDEPVGFIIIAKIVVKVTYTFIRTRVSLKKGVYLEGIL